MRRYRKGQLFLIEMIIAVSVLLVLVTTLFSTQTITSPSDPNTLDGIGDEVIDLLVDSGYLYEYFGMANYSYYTLGQGTFDQLNSTKVLIGDTIASNIPLIANFKVQTWRYNPVLVQWESIDTINNEATTPTGTDISVTEFYIPGFNGGFDEFRFVLNIWYEVGN